MKYRDTPGSFKQQIDDIKNTARNGSVKVIPASPGYIPPKKRKQSKPHYQQFNTKIF